MGAMRLPALIRSAGPSAGHAFAELADASGQFMPRHHAVPAMNSPFQT